MNDQGRRGSARTPLTRSQILGFWAAWGGWVLDGMDMFIFALVISPALRELLEKSGGDSSSANVARLASILFALFLIGWGLSFLWGPAADRFGRKRVLAASVACYALFTGAMALAQNVWELGLFRLLAGAGIGGEWSLAGTYVAEIWPEDRRKAGSGYLHTGAYAGFFLAATLNYTVGAHFGWRAMFACGVVPVVLALYMLARLEEPARWKRLEVGAPRPSSSLRAIFSPPYARRTLINSILVTIAIIGLWAGAVYEPTAIAVLAHRAGYSSAASARAVSVGTGILSVGTIAGCLVVPWMAERIGRRGTLACFFAGMAVCIYLGFGWAFYLPRGLIPFIGTLFVLGLFGANFATFTLWLPEQYPTAVRATAFAFVSSVGRFVGAGVNFALAMGIAAYGSVGMPVAYTAAAFVLGLIAIPFALETRGCRLPE